MSVAVLRTRFAGGLGPFFGDQEEPSNGTQAALEAWFFALQGVGQATGLLGSSSAGASEGPSRQDQIDSSLSESGDAQPLYGRQQVIGDLPACSMPLPVSRQPVVETEGFLPFDVDSEPRGPACSMPLPLERQRSDNGPLFIAGGYDRNFLALLGKASANGPAQVGRLAGGLSPAAFSAWHEALSPSAMVGGLEAIYPAQRVDALSLMNPSFEIGERT
mgnify:CR=1 FL=1